MPGEEISMIEIPKRLLLEADQDKDVSGYVFPEETRHRIPILSDKGDVVGFMTPRKEGNAWRSGAIYVSKEHRGKGYASDALVNFFSNKSGRAYIDDSNTSSQGAFRKAGFKPSESAKKIEGLTQWVKEAATNKYLEKIAEHHPDDAAAVTLINKVTNPISWAAKIDLYGNTSTRVAALALNTLIREANKQ